MAMNTNRSRLLTSMTSPLISPANSNTQVDVVFASEQQARRAQRAQRRPQVRRIPNPFKSPLTTTEVSIIPTAS